MSSAESNLPYQFHAYVQELRDSPEHLDLHAQTGDYFAYLATLLGFLQEVDPYRNPDVKEFAHIAEELRKDLRYLNSHYQITRKEKSKNS